MKVLCFYGCGTEIDPTDRYVWRRVTGWEHRASTMGSRRGGSDITMREPTGEFACDTCVRRMKAGINPRQEGMF